MRTAELRSTLRPHRLPALLPRCILFALSWTILCSVAPGQQQPALDPTATPSPATTQSVRKARTGRFLAARMQAGASTAAAARALNSARAQRQVMLAQPRDTSLSAAWSPVGPAQVATAAFGNVTGRVTAIAIDPADATGNTVYLGSTGGGVWKSTNAAGPASTAVFTPLTDTLPIFSPGTAVTPSLSIGAVAIANGVLLAGTGDPNDATDSYYGSGILRSTDAGATWTIAQQSLDGVAGNHSFFGLGVAGLAFSTLNPSLVIAALSQSAEGTLVNAPDSTYAVKGLYYSTDAGLTWHMATISDGSQVIQGPQVTGTTGNAATAVVWNAARQRFYAAVRFHGFYQSADGVTWTRLTHQPGAGLTTTACPTNPGLAGSSACPIFRGALAVQPATGDTFALTVSSANVDQGLYQDVCAIASGACGNAMTFSTALNATPLESNSTHLIPQGDYDLTLAAAPSGTDTILYAGTMDLYRCSLAAGCSLRNTTNAANGCASNALVAPAQHAIASLTLGSAPLLYLGNDGGLWRSTDGVNQTAAPCSLDDATHFQNLNRGLGSLAEVVSFAQSPTDPATLLAGLGALGTAGTSTVTTPWLQLAAGEGGTVMIDPANPQLWYLSNNAGISIARCSRGAACTAADFVSTVIGPAQTSSDPAEVHAPWLLDPGISSNLIAGTCRAYRGPASDGALWSGANAISAPLGVPAASACSGTFPLTRSLAAGGPTVNASAAQSSGSQVIYAGIAGAADGGQGFAGHVFVTTAANAASSTTAWTDVARANVTNDAADSGVFNPGGFDISSLAVDPHDATGRTVYATVMGFAANNINAPHLYRSIDAGVHWTNISSNLPNAPANSVVVDPNDADTLYIALDTGVFVTTRVATCASTNCWTAFGSALPNAPVIELAASATLPTGDGRSGELRAATYGRGIWQIPLLTATAPAVPVITLSPTTVTYSAQQVGTISSPVTVTVTNTGTAPLTVSSVVATGDFTETDPCVGTPIPQGAACSIQVAFAPTAAGARTGLLTVYGNVSGGQATAALSGTATPGAAIVLTPAALTFPATAVAITSAAQNITISNTGGTTSAIQAPVITGDFHISASTCGSSLGTQSGCTVSIVFTPTASGTRTGTLSVTGDTGTQVATLTGTGTTPATDSLMPLALSFPQTQLNTVSATQPITLTNSGDVALTLITAQVTSGEFTVVNSCGNSLNAHSTCSFNVAFAPHSVGAQTGILTITDQFRSQTIQLNGTGLAPAGVSISPTTGLAFGPIGIGLNSPVQTVTLTNNGGVPLTISSITSTADFPLATGLNTCGATLAPAAVCTVGVTFAPAAPGSHNGSITFVDSAVSSPHLLALSGTGVDFTLTPSGATTMTVTSGQSAVYALLLDSAAGLPGNATFTCTGAPAHATCTVNPSIAPLGATTPINVTIGTGLAHAAITPPAMPWTRQLGWLALLLPISLCRRRRLRGFTALSLTLCLTLLPGCAVGRVIPGDGTTGGSAPTPTPSGTYSIVVSSGSTGLVRTVNLTLIVQ